MPADNVTPFRPRRPPPKPKGGGLGLTTPRGKAVLVHVLTMTGFAMSLFFTTAPMSWLAIAVGFSAAAIAYSNRAEGMPWAATHHEFAFRTLLIGFSLITLIRLPSYFFPRFGADAGTASIWSTVGMVMFWGTIIVLLWAGLRALAGFVLATMRKPIPHPRGMLI
jgi:uncharacterized membrane protein